MRRVIKRAFGGQGFFNKKTGGALLKFAVAGSTAGMFYYNKEKIAELIRYSTYQNNKPLVVALYDNDDGAYHADLAIEYFESEGLNVVKVSPEEGMGHEVFNGDLPINGIFLPGGSDIPVEDTSDLRRNFEGDLIRLAKEKDTPMLGICRGLQAIGFHSGVELRDMPEEDYEDYDYNNKSGHHVDNWEEVNKETGVDEYAFNNQIVVHKNTALSVALQPILSSDKQDFYTKCLHHQHLRISESEKKVLVAATDIHDNSIEAIEIPDGNFLIYGLQHHPEDVIYSCELERKEKIEKAAMKRASSIAMTDVSDMAPEYAEELTRSLRVAKAVKQTPHEKVARAEMGLFISLAQEHYDMHAGLDETVLSFHN